VPYEVVSSWLFGKDLTTFPLKEPKQLAVCGQNVEGERKDFYWGGGYNV